MKTALKRKNDEFLVMPLKHVLTVMGLVNHPETPKLWAIAHENVQTIIFVVNVHETPKQCAIAHENDPKTQKGEFLVVPLKNVLSVIVLVNHPETPKPWAIAHETSPKTQNMTSFWSCHSNM
jgi:hypothetical protein